MEHDKGLLVPINCNGKWKKTANGCWEYDAVSTKFIRLTATTTYAELIDKICAKMRISGDDNVIQVHAWVTYMTKEKLCPIEMEADEDISQIMELNGKREYVIPLCITTRPKGKQIGQSVAPISKEKPKSPVHVFNSKSVNKPRGGETVLGLDDIVMSNQFHGLANNITHHSTKKEKEDSNDEIEKDVELISESSAEIEKEDSNDEFESDDPFDNEDSDDHHERTDPFDCALSGMYDPYFHVFVDSSAKDGFNWSAHESPRAESMAQSPDVGQSHPPNLDTPVRTGTADRTSRRRDVGASDLQSSNIHVLTDLSVGETLPTKADLILRLRYLAMRANREFKITHSNTQRMIKDDDNRPNVIKDNLEKEYGIKVSYWKAWRAKEIARNLVRGDPAESFKSLPSYLWLLNEANPGTISAYEVDENNCFEQCFLAFGPCVMGFRSSIRPVIAVDASFLKGRYRGKLFVAACMDGNQQIFPLAFGVAATENDESWSWFLKNLKQVVGIREDLVFISDRHPSIEKCCKAEFPSSTYGICMFHLGMNMTAKYKVKAQQFLYGVAKAYTQLEFEAKFQHMKHTRRDIFEYLMDADPKKWARCFFPTRRYSIMTTNIAESMNALLKEAREFPIVGMLETIRTILQGWFHDRLRVAKEWSNKLTPDAEKKVQDRDDASRHFKVHPLDDFRFHIRDGQHDPTVDLQLRTCKCNVFQLDQLPCSHAIRAARERNISAYDLCSRYYTIEYLRQAYALPMNPVPHRSEWEHVVPESVKSVVVLPPIVKNKGRRKTKRMPSQGEEIVRKRCGRCRQTGHNKQRCTSNEYVPVHPLDKSN